MNSNSIENAEGLKSDREQHNVTGMPQKIERISTVVVIGEDLNNYIAITCLCSVSGGMLCVLDN